MIEKIDGLGPVRTTAPVKRAGKSESSSSAGFSRHMDETSETGATGSIASANSVGGILGAQEVDDALSRAARGKMRAQDILDRLDDLRLELLAGGISKAKLMQLSRMVSARRSQIDDPKLLAILDDIDLRAQVELAKYTP